MSERPLDVLCLGEALVDLLPDRRGRLRDCESFAVHSGGAPANVAVGLARLGTRTGLAGVLGEDELGRLLERKLVAEGIACHFRFTRDAPTGIWFIALDAAGDRTFFSPTGVHSADKRMTPADVAAAPIGEARFVHTGTSCYVSAEGQEALIAALGAARAAGTRTSFDPNVRIHLWRDPADLRALCARAFPLCDVVKLSDDEAVHCLGEADPERAARRLADLGVGLACITQGPRGVLALHRGSLLRVPAPAVTVVDTTGAGDGFVAGLLSLLATAPEGAPGAIPEELLERALRRACLVGSRVCTALGAVTALPRRGEVD